jgi:molybdopterin synthase sulfur carrier subunit
MTRAAATPPPSFFMATVFIPSLLRKLTGGKDRTVANGKNVRQLVDDLERQFPGFRNQVIENGELKPSLAVSIDGEVANQGLLDAVGENSEVHFLPALGGGL